MIKMTTVITLLGSNGARVDRQGPAIPRNEVDSGYTGRKKGRP